MYGVGGFFADVVHLRVVLEDDCASVDHADLVEVDRRLAVIEYRQVHFPYCLSEVRCGIMRLKKRETVRCTPANDLGGGFYFQFTCHPFKTPLSAYAYVFVFPWFLQ